MIVNTGNGFVNLKQCIFWDVVCEDNQAYLQITDRNGNHRKIRIAGITEEYLNLPVDEIIIGLEEGLDIVNLHIEDIHVEETTQEGENLDAPAEGVNNRS